MNASQLKPVGSLSRKYGVKSIVFGGPGCGKTPSLNSAPRPVLLVTEPGLLSMRRSQLPAFEAYSVAAINEFLKWVYESKEFAQFDTLCIDSISNVAEIVLADCLRTTKHGMKAYGEMSEKIMDICNKLYFMQQKHVIMIAKQALVENGKQTMIQDGTIVTETVMQKRPFFPGKDLNVKVPHLFDNVLWMGESSIPGQPKPVSVLRTKEIPEIFARARDGFGVLNELEPPDFTALFNKLMQ